MMISARGLTKRFGVLLALDGVCLELAPGERVALVGTNGSGKTTLLRALCGLLRVQGEIRIGGIDLARQPELALRALAYVPQVAPPLEAPVAELVRACCALRALDTERVERCASELGLALGAVGRTRVRDLSGGMKQKLLAALALAGEPPLLVCDEPTASLDPEARAAFFKLARARPGSSGMLLCSHRLDEVRELVDRVVELRDGRVLRDEPLADALARLPTCRVELCFGPDCLGGPDLDQLERWGFRRVDERRFRGHFTHADKLDRVQRSVARYASRLVDIQVVDSESLPSSQAASMRRAS